MCVCVCEASGGLVSLDYSSVSKWEMESRRIAWSWRIHVLWFNPEDLLEICYPRELLSIHQYHE